MSKTFGHCLTYSQLPLSDVYYILREVTGLNKSQVLYHKAQKLSDEQWQEFTRTVALRKEGKPLQYIFGRCYFYDREFDLNQSVLIPRPETELLVEKIIQDNRSKQGLKILDIGTGSGCIAIILALHLNCHTVDAVDAHTLQVARTNAARHDAKVTFTTSDIYSRVKEKYDIIVSNPPYIGLDEYQHLESQVKDYEPKTALLAEDNGTYFYKKILTDLNLHLSSKGSLYLEIGALQAPFITDLAQKLNFSCQIDKDLNGLNRMAIIKSKN